MKPEAEKDLEFILEKLRSTIETYKTVYPELMYLEQELKNTNAWEINAHPHINQLIAVNNWLKQFIMQYYIFRIISHRLEQDLSVVQHGLYRPSPGELYLEFAKL